MARSSSAFNGPTPPLGYPGELDPSSYVPLYHQLKEVLKSRIGAGEWKTGQMIPSENELAAAFDISAGTVKKALFELVRDGVVVRRQGKGTFVARPSFKRSFFRFFRHGAGQNSEDVIPVSRVLFSGTAAPPVRVREALNLSADSRCLLITRIRSLGGTPLMYEHIHLPRKIFKGFEKIDISQELLYPIYDSRYNTPIVWAEEFLEPRLAAGEVAGHLGLAKGAPLIYIERIAYTFGDLPVEFRRSYGRGDRFRYHIELR
ncbi:MAG: GntR family transcriptional regulator [Desulfobacterales bacterium]|jgi:GntR family transcriptional regulator|nr:GntR family transcriptional regulator [Desulfobacterales bacterium]